MPGLQRVSCFFTAIAMSIAVAASPALGWAERSDAQQAAVGWWDAPPPHHGRPPSQKRVPSRQATAARWASLRSAQPEGRLPLAGGAPVHRDTQGSRIHIPRGDARFWARKRCSMGNLDGMQRDPGYSSTRESGFSGGRDCLIPQAGVQSIRRKVSAIGPTYCAELINAHLPEIGGVFERLEYRPKQTPVQP